MAEVLQINGSFANQDVFTRLNRDLPRHHSRHGKQGTRPERTYDDPVPFPSDFFGIMTLRSSRKRVVANVTFGTVVLASWASMNLACRRRASLPSKAMTAV
jgi:hypothetical protein